MAASLYSLENKARFNFDQIRSPAKRILNPLSYSYGLGRPFTNSEAQGRKILTKKKKNKPTNTVKWRWQHKSTQTRTLFSTQMFLKLICLFGSVLRSLVRHVSWKAFHLTSSLSKNFKWGITDFHILGNGLVQKQQTPIFHDQNDDDPSTNGIQS